MFSVLFLQTDVVGGLSSRIAGAVVPERCVLRARQRHILVRTGAEETSADPVPRWHGTPVSRWYILAYDEEGPV